MTSDPPDINPDTSLPGDDLPPEVTRQLLDQVRGSSDCAQQSWFDLLERCESRLRTLLHFRLNPAVRATIDEDDLLQEVWIEAARKIHDFEYRGTGSLQRWLAAILRFKMMHAGRQAGRLPFPEASLVSGNSTSPTGLFDALSRTQPGVSHSARRQETEIKVLEVLATLPEDLRETVLLKVYEGLNGREAAEALGLSESGFSKRFHKALSLVGLRLKADEA